MGSSRLQKVEPLEYLRDVLRRVVTTPVSRVDELTPRGRRIARETAASSAPRD